MWILLSMLFFIILITLSCTIFKCLSIVYHMMNEFAVQLLSKRVSILLLLAKSSFCHYFVVDSVHTWCIELYWIYIGSTENQLGPFYAFISVQWLRPVSSLQAMDTDWSPVLCVVSDTVSCYLSKEAVLSLQFSSFLWCSSSWLWVLRHSWFLIWFTVRILFNPRSGVVERQDSCLKAGQTYLKSAVLGNKINFRISAVVLYRLYGVCSAF